MLYICNLETSKTELNQDGRNHSYIHTAEVHPLLGIFAKGFLVVSMIQFRGLGTVSPCAKICRKLHIWSRGIPNIHCYRVDIAKQFMRITFDAVPFTLSVDPNCDLFGQISFFRKFHSRIHDFFSKTCCDAALLLTLLAH